MDDLVADAAAKVAANLLTDAFKTCFKSVKDAEAWLKLRNKEVDFFGIAARKYAKRAESRYNSMRIFGMSHPVPLRSIYTRVNVLEKITAGHRETVEDLERYFDHDRRTFGAPRATEDGIETVNKLNNIIVLGKPGAGKTTFLKYILLQALDGNLTRKSVPVFVGLKDWADSKESLLTFIVRQFEICGIPDSNDFIKRLLTKGNCILLLDGFDEVNIGIDKVITEIREFVDKYPANQYILSCRIAAYNYCFEQFSDIEIADFTDEQIQAFIKNWFGKATIKARSCWRRIKDDRPIAELAAIPLLLTMLCLAFDETMEFPSNRAELYKEALDALLKRWDASRSIKRDEIYRHLSTRRKESMLSRIAASTFEADQYFLPQHVLERHIGEFIQHLPEAKDSTLEVDSEVILKAIEAQHGLFVERAKRIFSFSHLTFQEYFTARYVVDNLNKRAVEDLVMTHLIDDKWREVFLIISGMLERADDFLLFIKRKIDSLRSFKSVITIVEMIGTAIKNDKRGLSSLFPRMGESPAFDRISILSASLLLCQKYQRSAKKTFHGLEYSDWAFAFDLAREIGFLVRPDKETSFDDDLRSALNLMLPPTTPASTAAIREVVTRQGFDYMLDCALQLVNEADLGPVIDYLYANEVLARCLGAECYVSKATRKLILDGLLTFPAEFRHSTKALRRQ